MLLLKNGYCDGCVLFTNNGEVSCSAAITSLKVSKFLQEEMTYENVRSYF